MHTVTPKKQNLREDVAVCTFSHSSTKWSRKKGNFERKNSFRDISKQVRATSQLSPRSLDRYLISDWGHEGRSRSASPRITITSKKVAGYTTKKSYVGLRILQELAYSTVYIIVVSYKPSPYPCRPRSTKKNQRSPCFCGEFAAINVFHASCGNCYSGSSSSLPYFVIS